MSTQTHHPLFRPQGLAPMLGVVAAALGAAGFLSRSLGWAIEDHWSRHASRMSPNSAVCLLLAGVALALVGGPPEGVGRAARTVANLLTAVVLAIGAVTFFEHVAGVRDGRFDTLLLPASAWSAVPSPRMSIFSAASLVFLAGALLTLDVPRRSQRFHPADLLGVIGLGSVVVGVAGYGYDAAAWTASDPRRISAATALTLGVLSVGTLYARPNHGIVRLIVSPSHGGFVARRLLLSLFLLAPVVPFVRLTAQHAGLVAVAGGAALDAAAYMVLFAVVALWTAAGLIRAEEVREEQSREQKRTEAELRQAYDELEVRVAERTAELARVNDLLQADILQRTATEAALHSAKETAESASRSKSQFLANMSHEIRTPMNVILGMADLLWQGELSTEQRRYVRAAREAGDHLLGVIDDVLDFSKIEAGYLEVEHLEFEVRELVEQTVDFLAVRAQRKGLELLCQIDPEVSASVLGDAHRLRQVLVNLISNAIKFTDVGSIVVKVDVDPGPCANLLRFMVIDSGVGIPQTKLVGIFDSFTQADASITRKHGGTGLGLAISSRLVEHMGGRIWARSHVGKGSTFAFTAHLPAAPATADDLAVQSAALEAAPSLAAMRILLVDDAEDNRLLVQAYLRGTPWQLETAQNGAEAVALWSQGQFDLVLMDVQMPVMDGYTATRQIRARELELGLQPVPIVALTAHALDSARQESREAGCTVHLTKPVKRAALVSTVHKLVRAATAPAPATPPLKVDLTLAPLIPGYLRNRVKDIDRLQESTEKSDFAAIIDVGHSIKGSGTSYGFPLISDIGHRLEIAGRQCDGVAARLLTDELQRYLRECDAPQGEPAASQV